MNAQDDNAGRRPIRRALVSVSDKSGLVDLGAALVAAGVEIVSTGSTAATLAAAGIAVTGVASVTGFPECLDGRVKTLHPGIHAGLLADMESIEHRGELERLGIAAFQLVVVNLYPFRQTVASGADFRACVEQIDIGGPAMVRASAKNHASVAVVVDPDGYPEVIDALASGGFTAAQRRSLAADAFAHTASYDVAVASWLAAEVADPPVWRGATWRLREVLRYGENPHQAAMLYTDERSDGPGIADAIQLQGKPLSYNNIVDADAARRAAFDHREPAVAIIKHANPCGIGIGADALEAYQRAFATDPVSAFGGVVAANVPVTEAMADAMASVFTEVVVAPDFEPGALTRFAAREGLRVLAVPGPGPGGSEGRLVSGGVLVQQVDHATAPGDDPKTWVLACGPAADAQTLADLAFAWRACRCVKSNAILLAADGAAVGIGMGQVNRVDSARLAVARAGERAVGSVAASDAFFPFPDGVDVLGAAGVRAVVQPGGSIRDAEVIAAAQALGMTMYLTGTRHFLH